MCAVDWGVVHQRLAGLVKGMFCEYDPFLRNCNICEDCSAGKSRSVVVAIAVVRALRPVVISSASRFALSMRSASLNHASRSSGGVSLRRISFKMSAGIAFL